MFKFKVILILILINFVSLSSQGLIVKYESTLDRLECSKFDRHIIKHVNCSLKPIKRTLQHLNLEIHLIRPVNQIYAHIVMNKKNNAKYTKYLIDITEDICFPVHDAKESIVSKLIPTELIQSSNFNHSCPFEGAIIFKNYKHDNNVPTLLPIGKYRIDISILDGKKKPFVWLQMFQTVFERAHSNKYLII